MKKPNMKYMYGLILLLIKSIADIDKDSIYEFMKSELCIDNGKESTGSCKIDTFYRWTSSSQRPRQNAYENGKKINRKELLARYFSEEANRNCDLDRQLAMRAAIKCSIVKRNEYKSRNKEKAFEIDVDIDTCELDKLIREVLSKAYDDKELFPVPTEELEKYGISYIDRRFIFHKVCTSTPMNDIFLKYKHTGIKERNYSKAADVIELVDRKGMFEQIDEQLTTSNLPLYIHSDVGGLGKSHLLLAYCNSDCANQYKYVFFIDIENKVTDIRKSLMSYSYFNFNVDLENSSIETEFQRFLIQMKHIKENVLLVIDNVESKEQLQSIDEYIRDLRWKVIVTTRAIVEDESFKRRVIRLYELEINYCEELFSYHYKHEEISDYNRTELHEIFELFDRHTLLIKILAVQGHKEGLTVQRLHQMVINSDNLRNRSSYSDWEPEHHVYSKIESEIISLFKVSSIAKSYKEILLLFICLLIRPYPKDVLIEWMAGGDVKLNRFVNMALLDLYERGWLIRKRSEDNQVTYQCHSLIISALNSQVRVNPQTFNVFLKGIADFLYSQPSDRVSKVGLIEYFDTIDSIISSNNSVHTREMFALKKNYTVLLIHFSWAPSKAYNLAKYLKDNYVTVFGDSNQSYESKREWLEVAEIYATAFVEASSGGKYKTVMEMREANVKFAESFLPNSELLHLRQVRKLAVSLRSLDLIEKSIEKLLFLKECVEKTKKETNYYNREWTYFEYQVLSSLGASYSDMYRNVENKEKAKNGLLSALALRKYCVDLAETLYSKEPIGRVSAYNALGMNYLYLYDQDNDSSFLEEGKKMLFKSLEIRMELYGKASLSTATALSNCASVYHRCRDYESALKLEEEVLKIRLALHKDKNKKVIMKIYRKCSRTLLEIYKEMNDSNVLNRAHEYIKEALEIAWRLFDGNEKHVDVLKCTDIKNEIESLLLV